MVREAHGYKYHWAVADYLQRAARHIASKVDVEQAYAVGKAAVELAVKGVNAVMPTIVRKSSKPYSWTIGHVPLAEVANKEKKLPRDFITADGFGITDGLPPLSRAADRRRGLPALQGRPAGLRAHQGRAGAAQAQDRLQALKRWLRRDCARERSRGIRAIVRAFSRGRCKRAGGADADSDATLNLGGGFH